MRASHQLKSASHQPTTTITQTDDPSGNYATRTADFAGAQSGCEESPAAAQAAGAFVAYLRDTQPFDVEAALAALAALDINQLSPVEALTKLYELQQRIKSG